jgi:hypothetical protein
MGAPRPLIVHDGVRVARRQFEAVMVIVYPVHGAFTLPVSTWFAKADSESQRSSRQ